VAPHHYCDGGGLSTGMATYRIFQRLGETGSGPEGRKDGARPVRGPGCAPALEEEQAWAPADTRQSQSLSQPNTVDYRGVLSALGSAARGWGTAHTRWRQPRPPIHARPKPHGKTRWVEAYRGL